MNTSETAPASSTEEALKGVAQETAQGAHATDATATEVQGSREAKGAPGSLQRVRIPCLSILRASVLWIPQLAWAAVIIALSLHSQQSLAPYTSALSFPYSDKFMHLVEYGVFGILTVRAIHMDGRWLTSRRTLVAAAVFCSLFAILDENVQSLSPGRDRSVGDWMADTTGSFLGAWIWMVSLSGIVRRIHGGGMPPESAATDGQEA